MHYEKKIRQILGKQYTDIMLTSFMRNKKNVNTVLKA